jgi:nucleoid DNA-binding protein
MTKDDLTRAVALKTGHTQIDVKAVVEQFLKDIQTALYLGKSIELRGFGVFKPVKRKSRLARNPKTGEPVSIPARIVPVLKFPKGWLK